ncbi:MAG: hypothetical protein ACM3ZQ_05460 [Bacillota bacterium]
MSSLAERVVDGLDIETFIICETADQAKQLVLDFLKQAGFKTVDVVFVQHQGPGARIRARAYSYKPGDKYGWLPGIEAK